MFEIHTSPRMDPCSKKTSHTSRSHQHTRASRMKSHGGQNHEQELHDWASFQNNGKIFNQAWRQPRGMAPRSHSGSYSYLQTLSILPSGYNNSGNPKNSNSLATLRNTTEWKDWQNCFLWTDKLPYPLPCTPAQNQTFCQSLLSTNISQQIYLPKIQSRRTHKPRYQPLSRQYQLKCRELLDEDIGVAPAYQTRIRDEMAIHPSQRAFTDAYNLPRLSLITSKTRETAFQILNWTTWTNIKAFKSRRRPDPNCDRCGKAETMGHLLCECTYLGLRRNVTFVL